MNAEAKVATLDNLRRPAAPEASMPVVRAGFSDLQGFELAQRAARALSQATLVPKEFQGNLPNCLIALEMAQRIGASPLLVMQNLYVVHGRPGWSSKFLIASFNQCGRFSAIRYEWSGKQGADEWGCKAWAVEKETGDRIEGPMITIGLAKKEGWYSKSGSKWQTIPQLMLMYRAAGWLVNTHAPEISMGLSTTEDLGDTFDAGVSPGGQYEVTLDSLRDATPEPLAPVVAFDLDGWKSRVDNAEDPGVLSLMIAEAKADEANPSRDEMVAHATRRIEALQQADVTSVGR